MAHQHPLIVEVYARIQAGSWLDAQRQMDALLRQDLSQYRVIPLYMTSDVEDTEIRVCLQFAEPCLLETFVVSEIRTKVTGIIGTRIRLTLDGEIFPAGVARLISAGKDLKSCHVFLSIAAGKDGLTWEALRQLPAEDDIVPTWLFRDFYEYDRDVTVRLVGGSKDSFRSYVERHIGRIAGVRLWRLQFIDSMTHIASKELLESLASQWVSARQCVLQEKT